MKIPRLGFVLLAVARALVPIEVHAAQVPRDQDALRTPAGSDDAAGSDGNGQRDADAGEAVPSAPAEDASPSGTEEDVSSEAVREEDASEEEAREEEVDILSAEQTEVSPEPGTELGDSFGFVLEGLGLEATVSGYGEVVFYIDEDQASFDLWRFIPIIGAKIGEYARAEIEIEYEHGGEVQLIEYGFFEYAPSEVLTVRAGKVLVPMGAYNAALHPSFVWNQVSRPAMMENVIPAIWSEVGVFLGGRVELWRASFLRYDLYLTNGLGYDEGVDLTSERAFVRKFMRGNVRDNNFDKAAGGRVGLDVTTAGSGMRIVSGLSLYSAAVDPAERQRIFIVDYDLSLQAGGFTLRGEIAQTFWNESAVGSAIKPLERGSYLQASFAHDLWEFAVRWDNTFVRPGMGSLELHNWIVPSVKLSPDPMWSVRAEVRLPVSEPATKIPRLDLMASFSF